MSQPMHAELRRCRFSDLSRRQLIGGTVGGLAAVIATLYAVRSHIDIDLYQPGWRQQDYMNKQIDLGYRLYGQIEGPPRWPARAVRRVDGGTPGRIEFAAPSGQSHVYDNFPGVQFKAVTFAPELGGRNFVLVLGRPPAGN